jgi:transposase
MEKKTSIEDHQKDYSTLLKCQLKLLDARKNDKGKCFNPRCPGGFVEKHYKPINNSNGILCKICLGHFHPTVSSPMEHSHIDLVHWFHIIYLMLASRNGISANEVTRHYNYGPSAIFYMMHKIRAWMGECIDFDFQNAVVEIDESYIKTHTKGLGRHHRFKHGRGSERNSNILVIKQRGAGVKLFPMSSSETDSILPIIRNEIHTDSKCIIITDEWKAYHSLKDEGYVHFVVNHSEDVNKQLRYKNGIACTNNGENIFSIVKRSIKGSHINISEKYLPNYLNEIAFRITFKDEKDYGFEILLKKLMPLSEHYKNKFDDGYYPDKNDDN